MISHIFINDHVLNFNNMDNWFLCAIQSDFFITINNNNMIKNQQRTPSTEPICKKIQNYIFKFTDLLGKGNFSKVYKAHHQITNETVAIKIIELNSLKSQKLQQLLFSQIDVLKKLNHPNILRCFQVFTSNRNCYIITQICNGGDLETKLRTEHRFSELSAQPIIKDIFSGLLYLAQKNVIHRDLKVANVFLHNGRAKIADFGFAKFTRQNFKDINIGSPIYMSPQGLIHNIYGPKTDIWAFGVLIYQLLHGQTPFAQCRTQSELKYHVSIPINAKKMRDDISMEIKQIIVMCMEVDETKRVSALDLEKLTYFQRLLDRSPQRRIDSPVIQKKYSTASQKYVGTNNSSYHQQIMQKHNFLAPKEEQLGLNKLQKKSSSPANYRNQREQPNINLSPYQRRGISTQKQKQHFQQVQNSNNIPSSHKPPLIPPTLTSHSTPNLSTSKIFSTTINFKQCVNLLHYCRLIYKYVIILKEKESFGVNFNVNNPFGQDNQQVKILAGWVLFFMDQVKSKINQGGVIYDTENSLVREKKLREVTNQYTKKYSQELGHYPYADLSLSILSNYVKNFYQKIDMQITLGKDDSWYVLGHYIIMILQSTYLLKKCYEQHNYKPFSTYKQLEQFLNRNKDTLDSHSYKLFRKRVSFIKDRFN